MRFKQFLNEATYYHGTTADNAKEIVRKGIDPKSYKSGMFVGFHLADRIEYCLSRNPDVIFSFDIDDAMIMDTATVTDADLEAMDPHFRMMSYGWKNTLIERIAKERGMSGVRNGPEIVLFDSRAIKSMKIVKGST